MKCTPGKGCCGQNPHGTRDLETQFIGTKNIQRQLFECIISPVQGSDFSSLYTCSESPRIYDLAEAKKVSVAHTVAVLF